MYRCKVVKRYHRNTLDDLLEHASTLFPSAYLRVPMTATLWAGALLATVSVAMASRSHGSPID